MQSLKNICIEFVKQRVYLDQVTYKIIYSHPTLPVIEVKVPSIELNLPIELHEDILPIGVISQTLGEKIAMDIKAVADSVTLYTVLKDLYYKSLLSHTFEVYLEKYQQYRIVKKILVENRKVYPSNVLVDFSGSDSEEFEVNADLGLEKDSRAKRFW